MQKGIIAVTGRVNGMPEQKAKKKRLPLWAKLLITLLVLIIGFLGFAYGTIRYFVRDSLGFKGTLAMVGYGGFDMPKWFCDFVLDVDRSYPGLPELLVTLDGKAVTTPEEYVARRQELMDLYETYMYGKVPVDGFETAFSLEESGPALDGAALRQQVRITVSSEAGRHEAMLLVYLPTGAHSCGMFVGLNFTGNTAVWTDTAILPSLQQADNVKPGQEASSWPVDQIIAAGYGVATMYCGDWVPDDAETFQQGLISLFPGQNCTIYSVWAFGFSRGIDYLTQLEQVDPTAIASVGHSRLARASLWAGANDTRISLVTASCGGGYMRSPLLGNIDSSSTGTHWATPEHFSYEGRDKELPVDIHMLYALPADRHIYVSMGAQDLASDPVATYDAVQSAKRVWRDIYGQNVIPDGGYADLIPGTPQFSEGLAVHVHAGGHAITAEDWMHYIRYMEEYVRTPLR